MKNLKIKYKITLPTILILLIFSFGITLFNLKLDYNSGLRNYKITGFAIVKNAEAHAADHIYFNHIVELQRMIMAIKKNNTDILYAFILNPQKKVLVHTFKNGFPADLLKINTKAIQNVKLLDTGKETIYDFSYPIRRGELGILRIGMSRNRLITAMKRKIYISMIFLLGFLILAVFASLYVSNLLTKPLENLVLSTKKIANGDFNQHISIKSKDEIGLLASSFNSMCYKLQTLTDKLEEKIVLLNIKNNEYLAINEELVSAEEEIKQVVEKLIQTNEELEKSNKKQALILDTFVDGIFIESSDFEIEYMNKPMQKMLGEDKIGQKCHKAIYNKKEVCEWCVRKRLQKEKVITYELKHPITNRYYIIRTSLIDKGSKIITYHDITDLKEKELQLQERNTELKQAKEKAEESDQLKTEFIRNLSHEIRTPLNGIIGFSDFLDKPNLSPERKKYFIKIIKNSGKQLVHIVDEILEISELETTKINLVFKNIRLNDFLSDLFNSFEYKTNNKNIELKIIKKLPNQESRINTDSVILKKIIYNLLENALKFTNKGFIELGYRISGPNSIQIYVKDTGIGIRSDKLESIFLRFSQEEKELSKKVGGLGLGLSIAKRNAELLGGTITVESEKGKGSTFFLNLPIDNRKQSNTTIYSSLVSKKDTSTLSKNKEIILKQEKSTQILSTASNLTGNFSSPPVPLEKLAMAVKQSGNAIVITNIKGEIEYVNPRFSELTGYSPQEVLGKNLRILKSGEFNNKFYHNLWQTISSGKIWKGEFHNKRKDGSLYWEKTTISSLVNESGEIINYLGIKEDISSRKNAEHLLYESEKNFRLLFENSPLGTYIAKPDGTILRVNNATLQILGSPSAEATMQINVLKFPPLVKNGYAEIFKKCVQSGQIQIIELRYKSKWGKEIYLSNYIIPLKDEQGNVEIIYTIMDDVSDREEALNTLRENNITKDKFMSIIAHDLKNPFGAILGFSDVLHKNFETYDIKTQKKYIGLIHKEIENTYKLLENLLLWSRSQRKKIEFKPKKINLFLKVFDTSEFLSQLAKNKSIKLTNTISLNDHVFADKDMLSTILRNLISNAIKFTPKGGKIIISAETKTRNKNLRQIEISVKDTGVGISKEMLAKLFDITENTSTKGTENERGTGLGLILCKEFVEKHGGKIWVESEEGKGSEFIFTLPIE